MPGQVSEDQTDECHEKCRNVGSGLGFVVCLGPPDRRSIGGPNVFSFENLQNVEFTIKGNELTSSSSM